MARLELDPFIVAANVRETRLALGCTVEEFARLLEVTPEVVARYEAASVNSFPTEDKLALLLRLAGVTREAFLGRVLEQEEMNPLPGIAAGRVSAPQTDAPPPAAARKAPADYKRSRKSRIIRGVSVAVAACALFLTYFVNNLSTKINPDAVVFIAPDIRDYHVSGCPLIEGADTRAFTVLVAEDRGHSRCRVCIPLPEDKK